MEVCKKVMNKKYLKIISLLLAVIMFITAIPSTCVEAFAAYISSGQVKIEDKAKYGVKNYQVFNSSGLLMPYYNKGFVDGKGKGENCSLLLKYATNDKGGRALPSYKDVPVYRVSRAFGYTNNTNAASAVNAIDISDLMSTKTLRENAASDGINLSELQAKMIQQVLLYGLKQFTSNKGAQFDNEQLHFVATQCLIWEIEEGKRTGWGNNTKCYVSTKVSNYNTVANEKKSTKGFRDGLYASYNKNKSGSYKYYWHDFYYTVKNSLFKKSPDYYSQILSACKNMASGDMSYKINNSSQIIAFRNTKSFSEMKWNSTKKQYRISYTVTDKNFLGAGYGQYNTDWISLPIRDYSDGNTTGDAEAIYKLPTKDIKVYAQPSTSSKVKYTYKKGNADDVRYDSHPGFWIAGITKNKKFYEVRFSSYSVTNGTFGYVPVSDFSGITKNPYIDFTLSNNGQTINFYTSGKFDFKGTIHWTRKSPDCYNNSTYFTGKESKKQQLQGFVCGGRLNNETLSFKMFTNAYLVRFKCQNDNKTIKSMSVNPGYIITSSDFPQCNSKNNHTTSATTEYTFNEWNYDGKSYTGENSGSSVEAQKADEKIAINKIQQDKIAINKDSVFIKSYNNNLQEYSVTYICDLCGEVLYSKEGNFSSNNSYSDDKGYIVPDISQHVHTGAYAESKSIFNKFEDGKPSGTQLAFSKENGFEKSKNKVVKVYYNVYNNVNTNATIDGIDELISKANPESSDLSGIAEDIADSTKSNNSEQENAKSELDAWTQASTKWQIKVDGKAYTPEAANSNNEYQSNSTSDDILTYNPLINSRNNVENVNVEISIPSNLGYKIKLISIVDSNSKSSLNTVKQRLIEPTDYSQYYKLTFTTDIDSLIESNISVIFEKYSNNCNVTLNYVEVDKDKTSNPSYSDKTSNILYNKGYTMTYNDVVNFISGSYTQDDASEEYYPEYIVPEGMTKDEAKSNNQLLERVTNQSGQGIYDYIDSTGNHLKNITPGALENYTLKGDLTVYYYYYNNADKGGITFRVKAYDDDAKPGTDLKNQNTQLYLYRSKSNASLTGDYDSFISAVNKKCGYSYYEYLTNQSDYIWKCSCGTYNENTDICSNQACLKELDETVPMKDTWIVNEEWTCSCGCKNTDAKCSSCGKKYYEVHSGVNSWICPDCGNTNSELTCSGKSDIELVEKFTSDYLTEELSKKTGNKLCLQPRPDDAVSATVTSAKEECTKCHSVRIGSTVYRKVGESYYADGLSTCSHNWSSASVPIYSINGEFLSEKAYWNRVENDDLYWTCPKCFSKHDPANDKCLNTIYTYNEFTILPDQLDKGYYYYFVIKDNKYDKYFYNAETTGGEQKWNGYKLTYESVCTSQNNIDLLTFTDGNENLPIVGADVVVMSPEYYFNYINGDSSELTWTCKACGTKNSYTDLTCQNDDCTESFLSYDSYGLDVLRTDANGQIEFYGGEQYYYMISPNSSFTVGDKTYSVSDYEKKNIKYYSSFDSYNDNSVKDSVDNAPIPQGIDDLKSPIFENVGYGNKNYVKNTYNDSTVNTHKSITGQKYATVNTMYKKQGKVELRFHFSDSVVKKYHSWELLSKYNYNLFNYYNIKKIKVNVFCEDSKESEYELNTGNLISGTTAKTKDETGDYYVSTIYAPKKTGYYTFKITLFDDNKNVFTYNVIKYVSEETSVSISPTENSVEYNNDEHVLDYILNETSLISITENFDSINSSYEIDSKKTIEKIDPTFDLYNENKKISSINLLGNSDNKFENHVVYDENSGYEFAVIYTIDNYFNYYKWNSKTDSNASLSKYRTLKKNQIIIKSLPSELTYNIATEKQPFSVNDVLKSGTISKNYVFTAKVKNSTNWNSELEENITNYEALPDASKTKLDKSLIYTINLTSQLANTMNSIIVDEVGDLSLDNYPTLPVLFKNKTILYNSDTEINFNELYDDDTIGNIQDVMDGYEYNKIAFEYYPTKQSVTNNIWDVDKMENTDTKYSKISSKYAKSTSQIYYDGAQYNNDYILVNESNTVADIMKKLKLNYKATDKSGYIVIKIKNDSSNTGKIVQKIYATADSCYATPSDLRKRSPFVKSKDFYATIFDYRKKIDGTTMTAIGVNKGIQRTITSKALKLNSFNYDSKVYNKRVLDYLYHSSVFTRSVTYTLSANTGDDSNYSAANYPYIMTVEYNVEDIDSGEINFAALFGVGSEIFYEESGQKTNDVFNISPEVSTSSSSSFATITGKTYNYILDVNKRHVNVSVTNGTLTSGYFYASRRRWINSSTSNSLKTSVPVGYYGEEVVKISTAPENKIYAVKVNGVKIPEVKCDDSSGDFIYNTTDNLYWYVREKESNDEDTTGYICLQTVDKDLDIEVLCGRPYDVTTSITNGTITESQIEVDAGSDVPITFTPNNGYVVNKIFIDGNAVNDISEYLSGGTWTFENLNADHTISVLCEPCVKISYYLSKEAYQNAGNTDAINPLSDNFNLNFYLTIGDKIENIFDLSQTELAETITKSGWGKDSLDNASLTASKELYEITAQEQYESFGFYLTDGKVIKNQNKSGTYNDKDFPYSYSYYFPAEFLKLFNVYDSDGAETEITDDNLKDVKMYISTGTRKYTNYSYCFENPSHNDSEKAHISCFGGNSITQPSQYDIGVYDNKNGSMKVEFIEPNVAYKNNTQVVSTFKLTNDSNYLFRKGSLMANFDVYAKYLDNSTGKIGYKKIDQYTITSKGSSHKINPSQRKTVIVPNKKQNIFYFVWNTPQKDTDLVGSGMTFLGVVPYAKVQAVSESYGMYMECSTSYEKTVPLEDLDATPYVPETSYDLNGGNGFTYKDSTNDKTYQNKTSWQEYVFENGEFKLKTYYATLGFNKNLLTPKSNTDRECGLNPSKEIKTDKDGNKYWETKSGYAVMSRVSTTLAVSDEYGANCYDDFIGKSVLNAESAKVFYPENYFSGKDKKCENLYPEYVSIYGNEWIYCGNYDGMLNNITNNTNNGKYLFITRKETGKILDSESYAKHYIPVWYPDGDYKVQVKIDDCWTPAGALSYVSDSNTIKINGSLFDDYATRETSAF